MPKRTILFQDGSVTKPAGFIYICAGYLVEDNKVLLVKHNVFNKWVPPGGHIDAGDTFASAAAREVKEETGLDVKVISALPAIDTKDTSAITEPVPFHVDVEYGFKPDPAIVQFFWVRRTRPGDDAKIITQIEEVDDVSWFSEDELKDLPTFDQVRAIAAYALTHHPDAKISGK